MSEEVRYIDIKEFREIGFFQELNRQFLHPLGLALEVVCHEDGTESIKGVWDYRSDPEGVAYDTTALSTSEARMKADRVAAELLKHAPARIKMFGQVTQPVK